MSEQPVPAAVGSSAELNNLQRREAMGILTTHDTFQAPSPTCPHCGYALDTDDMLSNFSDSDLYALAPDEDSAAVKCPQCDKEYAVRGGYRPHYTSAFSLDEL